MSIRPDRWIRERALEGMITPFEDGLVREGVISYGLSSFGYDLRAAPEWRIFVNAFNTVVDPKHFDTRSLVEHNGDTCIIPPNSFALTRSVEYLRIPEDTMVIALGKSSYARCFSQDTRVALVDGSTPTLQEMTERHEQGEMFWGYSVGENGQVIVSLLDAPRLIGRDALLEITLDDGNVIKATPDHGFMRRTGEWTDAAELVPGDALMPLYRSLHDGYEMTYQPRTGYYYPTQRMADEWNLRHEIYVAEKATHRRHVDHDRLNNNPWNIVRLAASEHIHDHNSETYGADFDPDYAHQRSALLEKHRERWTESEREARRERQRRYWEDNTVARRAQGNRDVVATFRGKREFLNHEVVSVRELKGDHDVYCLTVPEAGNFALAAGVFVRNCGIVANVTPLEPGWEGHVTLELSNTTPLPAKVYANEGIVQLLFFQGERPDTTYSDRKGKYQGQKGVTLPRL